jgi:hypothetical protein
MAELGWRDAIVKVLAEAGEPMRYTDIAEAIATRALKTRVGATPAASVAATISVSLRDEGDTSPFVKVSRAVYGLRQFGGQPAARAHANVGGEEDEAGFINAFGMNWKRENVDWRTTPKLLGQQQGGQPVDFCGERGVYLLHDGIRVVYVGRTVDQALGARLRQHTTDRLNGRWDRFSWFGILGVDENGGLKDAPSDAFSVETLTATMEALLIEGLEPPQNRKRGDDFSAVEFIQVEDPELRKRQLIEELRKGLK